MHESSGQHLLPQISQLSPPPYHRHLSSRPNDYAVKVKVLVQQGAAACLCKSASHSVNTRSCLYSHMDKLLTNFVLLLLITLCCHCKSVSLASFLNAVSLRAQNLNISLSDVELRSGILSFNGIRLEGNGVHYNGAKRPGKQKHSSLT